MFRPQDFTAYLLCRFVSPDYGRGSIGAAGLIIRAGTVPVTGKSTFIWSEVYPMTRDALTLPGHGHIFAPLPQS